MPREHIDQMIENSRKAGLNPINYSASFGGISGQRDVVPVEVPSGPIKTGIWDVAKEMEGAGKKVMKKIPDTVTDFIIGGPKKLAKLAAGNVEYLYQVAANKPITAKPATPLQILAAGGESALDVITLGTGSIIAGGVKSAVKRFAIQGGVLGTAYGAAGALEKENPNFVDVAKKAAFGGITGLIGGAILGKVIGKMDGKKVPKMLEDIPAPEKQLALPAPFDYGKTVESYTPIVSGKKISDLSSVGIDDVIFHPEIGKFNIIKKGEKNVLINKKWVKEPFIRLEHFDGSIIDVSPQDIIDQGFKKVRITGQRVGEKISTGKTLNPENIIRQMADEGEKIPVKDVLKQPPPPPAGKIIVTKDAGKKGALGFYDTATGKIGLQDLMDNKTLIHETAHGRFESLPAEGQTALSATIAELKNNPQRYGKFNFTGNAKEDVAAFAEQYLFNKRKDKAFSKALADTPGGSDLVRFAKGAIDDAANKTIKISEGVAKTQTKLFKMDVNIPAGKYNPTPIYELNVLKDDPVVVETVKMISENPQYFDDLAELGGGKILKNSERFQEAISKGVFSIEQIANWNVNKGTTDLDIYRAVIPTRYWLKKLELAVNSGNKMEQASALTAIKRILPGFDVMMGVSGRTLQAQKAGGLRAVNLMKELTDDLDRLNRQNATPDEITKKLGEILKSDVAQEAAKSPIWKQFLKDVESIATMNKVFSVSTQLVNIAGSVLNFFIVRPIEKGGIAFSRLAKGDVKGAYAPMKYIFGTSAGYRDAGQKILRTLLDTNPDFGMVEKSSTRIGKGFLGKGIEAAEKAGVAKYVRPFNPFRWLAAADNAFKAVIHSSELTQRAYELALDSKVSTPEEFIAKVAEFLTDNKVVERAKQEALEFTFQKDPDKVLNWILSGREIIPGSKLLVPFIKTPWNIIKFQAQRSPLGIMGIAKDFKAGGFAREEAIGRMAVATVLTTIGYAFAKTADMTGVYPSDPKEIELWKAEGKKAFSIKINGHWLAYNRFQPLGIYLTQATMLRDIVEGKVNVKDPSQYASFVFNTAEYIKDLPFVSGLNSIFEILNSRDQELTFKNFVNLQVQGLFPTALRDARQIIDPTLREEKGYVADSLANIIPFVSKNLQPKTDILGRERKYTDNPALRLLKVFSQDTKTPATEFMAKVGYVPEKPDAFLDIRGQDKPIELIGEDKTNYFKEIGMAVEEAVNKQMKSSAYDRLTPIKQKDKLSNAIADAKRKVKNKWERDFKRKSLTK